MITRIKTHVRIVAMLVVSFALMGQLAASGLRVYYPPFGRWVMSSSVTITDELDLSSQESDRTRKIMNHESTPLRMRGFRVIDRQGGNYSKWIVVEDVKRAQFRVGSYASFEGAPGKEMKATMDRDDAWNVLDSLRGVARFPEDAQIYWPVADSIDAAISQHDIWRQELWDWARHGKTPSWAEREHKPVDEKSKPAIMATPDSGLSEEKWQQMTQEVWDFAGGKRLKWKPVGRTPAGRKYEVLTFDGQEEVLVGPTSISTGTKN